MDFIKKITSVLETLSPTCRQAARLQCDALEQSLPQPKRLGLWLHLLICKWCRRYGRQIRFLNEAAHTHPDVLNQAGAQKLSDEARARIKNNLRNH
jgi:hypothetical protein